MTLLAFRAKADSIYNKSRIISTFAKSGNKNSLALTFLNLLVLSWEFLGRGRRLRRKKLLYFQRGDWVLIVVNRMENGCGVLKVRLFSLPTYIFL